MANTAHSFLIQVPSSKNTAFVSPERNLVGGNFSAVIIFHFHAAVGLLVCSAFRSGIKNTFIFAFVSKIRVVLWVQIWREKQM